MLEIIQVELSLASFVYYSYQAPYFLNRQLLSTISNKSN